MTIITIFSTGCCNVYWISCSLVAISLNACSPPSPYFTMQDDKVEEGEKHWLDHHFWGNPNCEERRLHAHRQLHTRYWCNFFCKKNCERCEGRYKHRVVPFNDNSIWNIHKTSSLSNGYSLYEVTLAPILGTNNHLGVSWFMNSLMSRSGKFPLRFHQSQVINAPI